MKMNGKSALGLICLVVGGLIVLNFVGLALVKVIGFLFPFILMGLGWLGIRNGRNVIGGALFVIGLLVMIAKFKGLVLFLIAAGLVVWGISMIRKNNKNVY